MPLTEVQHRYQSEKRFLPTMKECGDMLGDARIQYQPPMVEVKGVVLGSIQLRDGTASFLRKLPSREDEHRAGNTRNRDPLLSLQPRESGLWPNGLASRKFAIHSLRIERAGHDSGAGLEPLDLCRWARLDQDETVKSIGKDGACPQGDQTAHAPATQSDGLRNLRGGIDDDCRVVGHARVRNVEAMLQINSEHLEIREILRPPVKDVRCASGPVNEQE